jgi:hypothetical protein
LRHQSFDEAEVASGDADDGADYFTVLVDVGSPVDRVAANCA